MHFLSRPSAVAAVAACVVSVAVALVVATGVGVARASGPAPCTGQVVAGHSGGIMLRANGLSVTGVSCGPARGLVRDYLHVKLTQRSERCAGLAQTPPYRGCIVRGYRCRATGRPRLRHGRSVVGELCTDGPRAIRFSESDTSAQ